MMQVFVEHTQQVLQVCLFAHLHVCSFMQVFLEHTAGATGEELEREMFILRKVIEKAKFAKLKQDGMSPLSDFYICTMSSKTICYKVGLNSHKRYCSVSLPSESCGDSVAVICTYMFAAAQLESMQ